MEKGYERIGGNYVIMTYDYIHKLGRGAFADVYRCRKIENGKILPELYVAKEIHFQRNLPNLKELITQEINIMFQLTGEDPIVIKIYDFFTPANSKDMYIVMEHCEGGDLEKYADDHGPLPEALIAALLHPVAKSFIKIHGQGVIHRDLKLANILLYKKIVKGEEPQVRLTDFGLARVMENNETALTTCGTPLYMAPELWDHKEYTGKVDVWAFGIMLYKLMYGVSAFESLDVEKKVQQGILRLSKLRLASLEALDLILKCLRKNPLERVSFEDIAAHPFFTKKEFRPFERLFDGYFGFIEINIDNTYDLLANPNCLGLPQKKPDLISKHNDEVLSAWAKKDDTDNQLS